MNRSNCLKRSGLTPIKLKLIQNLKKKYANEDLKRAKAQKSKSILYFHFGDNKMKNREHLGGNYFDNKISDVNIETSFNSCGNSSKTHVNSLEQNENPNSETTKDINVNNIISLKNTSDTSEKENNILDYSSRLLKVQNLISNNCLKQVPEENSETVSSVKSHKLKIQNFDNNELKIKSLEHNCFINLQQLKKECTDESKESPVDSVSLINNNQIQEVFLKEVNLQRKDLHSFEEEKMEQYDNNTSNKERETKLLQIKENNELLKTMKLSTTDVYKNVKKRKYLQIKRTEKKSKQVAKENNTEYYFSTRTKRKRKKIDYVSLDHGLLYYEEMEAYFFKKRKTNLKDFEDYFENIPSDEKEIDEPKLNTLENNSELDVGNKSNINDHTTTKKETMPLKRKKHKKQENGENGETKDLDKTVTCAICNMELDFTAWTYHKQRHHNNLAWRVGDPPLDLNDETLVMRILGELYKKNKRFYCEKCGISKKSVVGYLSHKSLCQKSKEEKESVKIKCEHCDRSMLPVSMATHLKFCHGSPRKNKTKTSPKICGLESKDDQTSPKSENKDDMGGGKIKTRKVTSNLLKHTESTDTVDALCSNKEDVENKDICKFVDNIINLENHEISKSSKGSKNTVIDKSAKKGRSKEISRIVENNTTVKKEVHQIQNEINETSENVKKYSTCDDISKTVAKESESGKVGYEDASEEAHDKKVKKENQTQKVFTSLFAQIGGSESFTAKGNLSENKLSMQNLPRRRGRLPKEPKGDRNLTNKKETLMHVECAICNIKMEYKNWQYHKLRRHNNLAWKVGDPPIDLNDHSTIVYILNDIYKQRKPLYCEKCDTPKKSVMGYLSHKSVCQKSEEEKKDLRIQCEYCQKSMMPVSMPTHLKYCRAINSSNTSEATKTTEIEVEEITKGKRSAATKAQKFIEEFSRSEAYSDENTSMVVSVSNVLPSGKSSSSLKRSFVKCSSLTLQNVPRQLFRRELKLHGSVHCRMEDCAYESFEVNEMLNHLIKCCKRQKTGFLCKSCVKVIDSEDKAIAHLKEHKKEKTEELYEESPEKSSSESESEEENKTNKVQKQLNSNSIIRNFRVIKFLPKPTLKHAPYFFPVAYDWTIKFCERNFSRENLFPSLSVVNNNWVPVSPVLVNQYLPFLRYSCCTARRVVNDFVNPLETDYDWKTYWLFESELFEDGSSIAFCGGLVQAMAWAPTPFNKKVCDQILAVAVVKKLERSKINKISTEPGLIQFWNYGQLVNGTRAKKKPQLEFCVAHQFGTIYSMEWCPSGCYDLTESDENSGSLRRLGLLAVACSDSNVYIYSVCTPSFKNERVKVFKPKPMYNLQLVGTEFFAFNGSTTFPVKLSWTKASGHRFLAVGYTDGLAAVYDLCTESELIKSKNNDKGTKTLLPYKVIKAHSYAITGISLFHLGNGSRWLMTTSMDRSCRFWDLENPAALLCDNKKFLITDAVWLNHWICSIYAPDDTGFEKILHTTFSMVRNFNSGATSLWHALSRVNTISGCEWTNSCIQGTSMGEVAASFFPQLFHSVESHKKERRRISCPLSYVGLIEKHSTIEERLAKQKQEEEYLNIPEEDESDDENLSERLPNHIKESALSYDKVSEMFGLVFCDFNTEKYRNLRTTTPIPKTFRTTKVTIGLSSWIRASFLPPLHQ